MEKIGTKPLMIYIGVGLILIVSYFTLPGVYEFTQEDMQYHKEALKLARELSALTWKDFDLQQVPLAYRKGDVEYLLRSQELIGKRKPVLPVMAASIYEVEGEVQGFIPTKQEMDQLGNLVEGFTNRSVEENMIKEFAFGTREEVSSVFYLATIIHEGFHVYQITRWDWAKLAGAFYPDNLSHSESDSLEKRLMSITKADEIGEKIQFLYQQEASMLLAAYQTQDVQEVIECLQTFFEVRKERRFLLQDYLDSSVMNFCGFEKVYELLEGTATYLMYKSFVLKEDEGLRQRTLDRLGKLEKDRNRFYTLGMGVCLVLERWGTDMWFSQLFDPSSQPVSLEDLLKSVLEELEDGRTDTSR